MAMVHLSTVLIWTISLASILCMLLRPRQIAEAYWACGGAILLVTTRLISLRQAARAVSGGWNVYLFLAGMMILAELAREKGVFDWLADLAAQRAQNSPGKLFVLIYIVGVLVTVFLSNDATAVVLTPAVLAVVRRAKVPPKPYLLGCAFVASAASFVFPISNPANLVVFGQQIPVLGAWLRIFILPSCASILITFFCLWCMSRGEFRGEIAGYARRVGLSTEGKLAATGLAFAGIALIGSSALGLSLGLPTCGAALFAMFVVACRNRNTPLQVARGVSWLVLPLVAGLFIIVEALQNAGLLHLGLAGLHALDGVSTWMAKGISALAVALLSNGMNNLPIGLMSGAAIRQAGETGVISHAILIGVDLGPNLSVTGSLATILWLISLRRAKVEITAREFFKVGGIAMPAALIASLLFLWN